MPRKLKTYQTSLGFYDLAIAARSMKAALEGWGAGSNLFHQGVARETDDPDLVAATMSKPGLVLKRPAGSSRRFAAFRPFHRPGWRESRTQTRKGPLEIEGGQDERKGCPQSRLGFRKGAEAARSRTAARRSRDGEGARAAGEGSSKGAGGFR